MKKTGLLPSLLLLLLLVACGESHQQMVFQLEELERQNRADSLMLNDSLALRLADFFDRHGSTNERLRAHYILGRTYADMGEAPAALSAYLDAADCADTTRSDCDYQTLYKAYAQMATIFHKQNLPQDEIIALNKYSQYVRMDNPTDTTRYLVARRQMVRPYFLLGEKDSVLEIIEQSTKQLLGIGSRQEAARGLLTAIYIYTERGQLHKANELLTTFERESNLFDAKGNIAKGREDYYWIKGNLELAKGNMETADSFFRKGILYGSYEAVSSSYKGMLSIFHHKRDIDSIAHYSHLNEYALDSLHKRIQTDAVHQASALYNYTRNEKKAERAAREKQEARYLLGALLIFGIILTASVILFYRRRQKEKQKIIGQLSLSLALSKKEQQSICDELEKLKSMNYDELIANKERKMQELAHRIQTLEQQMGQSLMTKSKNKLEHFKDSQIVKVFSKKALFTKDHPVPNKAEWNALINQFIKDMPETFNFFSTGKKLSQLELQTCILLILDYEEGIIAGLTKSSSAAISIAKGRANQKLFKEKSALTLKYNLKKMI